MDSEKGNRVFARGAQCAPPWFLEPKKSLVWIGLRQVLLYMAMGFRPHSFPVGGMYVKGIGWQRKFKKITRFSFPLLLKRKRCYPGQKKEPSSRFAARKTLFHVWYHARSGAISAGQVRSATVHDFCPALIEHDITRGTAFFSPRISRMVLFFLSRVVLHKSFVRTSLGKKTSPRSTTLVNRIGLQPFLRTR